MMEFQARMAQDKSEIERYLANLFTEKVPYQELYDAMRYSLLAGGKRLRPVLAMEVCRMCGEAVEKALPLGCAVEMVHTYSLIHDDLPAMDNDDLRRGKPTSHKVFGEATAILAGDALLTGAFTLIATAPNLTPVQRVDAVQTLSTAAGPDGMVGGQVLDMAGEGKPLAVEQVQLLQSLKTGALIRAAARMGCIAANAPDEIAKAVDVYAEKIGLAFQVRDDILDVVGDLNQLGKPIGSDEKEHKTTFVTLLGLERCQEWVLELSQAAKQAVQDLPGSEFLVALADQLAQREH